MSMRAVAAPGLWTAMAMAMAAATGLLAAAGGGKELKNPGSDASADAGGDTALDGTQDGSGLADAESDGDTGVPFESRFVECTDNSQCSDAEICFQSVCVRPPLVDAELWKEQDNDYVPAGTPPDFSCWQDPVPLGAADPATATIHGDVALFGPESQTVNLCVTVYDNDLLMRWMVWLDEHVCGALHDVDLQQQTPYINCFALDPCRCNDATFTADRGDAGSSQDACYAEIGFCSGISDEGLQAQCRANILERTGMAADTLIYGTAVSTHFPDNPDRIQGVYEVSGVPTNTRLAVKVSGSMRRWHDTYEYGALIQASQVTDGRATWDANVITDGAWRTIPQSAGIPDPTAPDRAAVAGVVRDCGGTSSGEVLGARVGLLQDPVQIAYFNGVASDTLPQPGQAYTNKDGVYAAISLPAGVNRVSAIAQQNGVQVSAGARDVFVTPFSVILATFEGNWE